MTERELRKLNRTDLLELLLQQSREMEQLREELDDAKFMLSKRELVMDQAGSIAEAALQLNGVFAAAEDACAQYVESIKTLSGRQEEVCRRMEEETRQKCDKMLADAKYQSEVYWDVVNKKVEQLLDSQKGLRDLLQNRAR